MASREAAARRPGRGSISGVTASGAKAIEPGTHILPHRGVTNTRVVCHLPLVVPEGCAITVGGERREWRVGEAIAFDDTYEHEAWNRGTATRVVLIIDVWNPSLTAAERDAVATLAETLGDFNKAAGI